VWLRQQGKELYNGKQLGFTQADVQAWFELWKGARDARATPTSDVIHEGNATDVTKQLVVTGKALTSWVWANQLPELQKNTKDQLGTSPPRGHASSSATCSTTRAGRSPTASALTGAVSCTTT
jgi:multiple sugar transport system substrate-binding protein